MVYMVNYMYKQRFSPLTKIEKLPQNDTGMYPES